MRNTLKHLTLLTRMKEDGLRNEQRENETAQQKALEKYSELDTPFYLHSGISKDAFDYIELYILFLAILCVAIEVLQKRAAHIDDEIQEMIDNMEDDKK